MIAIYLWEVGSAILLILGSIHLYFTFYTNKFSSKNEELVEEMKKSHPILTKEITMWKAWIGFNASHSSGAMFIGAMNLYLAFYYFSIIGSSHLFFLFNIGTVAFYLWLAKKYWFSTPFYGIAVTLVCYVLSYVLVLF